MKGQRWRLTAGVGLAVLAVLVLASVLPDGYAEPTETFWAAMGAGGSVYGGQVWRSRWLLDRWRRRVHFNGLFALTSEQHAVLRLAGFVVELLILVSGISAMATPPSVRQELRLNDLITTFTLIGIGVVSTFAVWYAERKADQQARYILMHPEE